MGRNVIKEDLVAEERRWAPFLSLGFTF